MGLTRPVEASITDDWQEHVNRGSSEPGTDYASPYGSLVVAVGDGVVTYVKTTNSSATGRVVEYRLDEGKDTRSIHMSEVWVGVGNRVVEGQSIGLSGASGYGSDWYYGPHVHHTLWPGNAWANPTIDFELYVGSDEPDPDPAILEDDMIRIQADNRGIAIIGPGYYRHLANNDEVNASQAIITKHVNGTDAQFDLWVSIALEGVAAKS
jgi:murein DD-endopeptidase MepM/ murein hydrolase activator NlpD